MVLGEAAYGVFFTEDGVGFRRGYRRLQVGQFEGYVFGLGLGFFECSVTGEIFGGEMLPEGGWSWEGCSWDLLLLVRHYCCIFDGVTASIFQIKKLNSGNILPDSRRCSLSLEDYWDEGKGVSSQSEASICGVPSVRAPPTICPIDCDPTTIYLSS